jgi:hypothetical protein
MQTRQPFMYWLNITNPKNINKQQPSGSQAVHRTTAQLDEPI